MKLIQSSGNSGKIFSYNTYSIFKKDLKNTRIFLGAIHFIIELNG